MGKRLQIKNCIHKRVSNITVIRISYWNSARCWAISFIIQMEFIIKIFLCIISFSWPGKSYFFKRENVGTVLTVFLIFPIHAISPTHDSHSYGYIFNFFKFLARIEKIQQNWYCVYPLLNSLTNSCIDNLEFKYIQLLNWEKSGKQRNRPRPHVSMFKLKAAKF